MKSILLKNCKLFEDGVFGSGRKDIYIEDGIISRIGTSLAVNADQEISSTDLHVSCGWMDLQGFVPDPGSESKETWSTGLAAAASGGFTSIAVGSFDGTQIDSREKVDYVAVRESSVVKVLPIANVTEGGRGESLTQMMDLQDAGAVAFSEGVSHIWHAGILLRALQYVQKSQSLIINQPRNKYLSQHGQVHEGVESTKRGLPGIPSLAETVAIKRDLDILRYTGGKMHFSCISTKEAVELIFDAKREGLHITADVAAHQLLFDDSTVSLLDTMYKVLPPYRGVEDREALREGIRNGTIDGIVSDHQPQDEEEKKLEFDLASFGVSSYQTAFSTCIEALGMEGVGVIVKSLAENSYKILGLESPSLKEGMVANLTVFDPSLQWEVERSSWKSKALNSPFFGQTLQGKVLGVISGKNVSLNDN